MCGIRKFYGDGSALVLSIAPGASASLTSDMRLHSPDGDQHQRLGLAAYWQQPLQAPPGPAQAFDAARLPSDEACVIEAEEILHGRVSQ